MKKISSTIQEIIKDAKRGKMFILVDNKDRENEGDLVLPASKVNPNKINFMAKHGRGLICLALTSNKVKKLKLPLMSSINKSRTQTAFTISIESKRGVTSGISAQDRAKTIKVAIQPNSSKKDMKYLVEKGSIGINGVSLTISKLFKSAFEISVIPHTLKLTNLSNLKKGNKVNIEFDLVGKYLNNIYN